jgi:hypothetical protein
MPDPYHGAVVQSPYHVNMANVEPHPGAGDP